MRIILRSELYSQGKKRTHEMSFSSKRAALEQFNFFKRNGHLEDDRRGNYIYIPLKIALVYKGETVTLWQRGNKL